MLITLLSWLALKYFHAATRHWRASTIFKVPIDLLSSFWFWAKLHTPNLPPNITKQDQTWKELMTKQKNMCFSGYPQLISTTLSPSHCHAWLVTGTQDPNHKFSWPRPWGLRIECTCWGTNFKKLLKQTIHLNLTWSLMQDQHNHIIK